MLSNSSTPNLPWSGTCFPPPCRRPWSALPASTCGGEGGECVWTRFGEAGGALQPQRIGWTLDPPAPQSQTPSIASLPVPSPFPFHQPQNVPNHHETRNPPPSPRQPRKHPKTQPRGCQHRLGRQGHGQRHPARRHAQGEREAAQVCLHWGRGRAPARGFGGVGLGFGDPDWGLGFWARVLQHTHTQSRSHSRQIIPTPPHPQTTPPKEA